MIKKVIIEISCYAFVILFTYAAISKLIDLRLFKAQVSQSPLLIDHAEAIVWLVPIAELLISGLLLIPKTRLVGLYLSFGTMVAFTTYIIAILKFSDYVPCSCGGILSSMGWTSHLVFNLAFVLLAIIAIWTMHKEQNESPETLRNLTEKLS